MGRGAQDRFKGIGCEGDKRRVGSWRGLWAEGELVKMNLLLRGVTS